MLKWTHKVWSSMCRSAPGPMPIHYVRKEPIFNKGAGVNETKYWVQSSLFHQELEWWVSKAMLSRARVALPDVQWSAQRSHQTPPPAACGETWGSVRNRRFLQSLKAKWTGMSFQISAWAACFRHHLVSPPGDQWEHWGWTGAHQFFQAKGRLESLGILGQIWCTFGQVILCPFLLWWGLGSGCWGLVTIVYFVCIYSTAEVLHAVRARKRRETVRVLI